MSEVWLPISILLSRLLPRVCQEKRWLEPDFHCVNTNSGKAEGGGGKAETLTGVREPIICDRLWPVQPTVSENLRSMKELWRRPSEVCWSLTAWADEDTGIC